MGESLNPFGIKIFLHLIDDESLVRRHDPALIRDNITLFQFNEILNSSVEYYVFTLDYTNDITSIAWSTVLREPHVHQQAVQTALQC